MERHLVAGLALVAVGLALVAGGLVLVEVPDQHVHDTRPRMGGVQEDAGNASATVERLRADREELRLSGVYRYDELSPSAQSVYVAALESNGRHRTGTDVDPPEFEYGRSPATEGSPYGGAHTYAIVHDEASEDAMPIQYSDGRVDLVVTKTRPARFPARAHLVQLAGVLVGVLGVVGGGYVATRGV